MFLIEIRKTITLLPLRYLVCISKMAHWDNNLLNISLSKMVSQDKYQVLRIHVEEAMARDWINLLYIFNQGGSVLLYN